MNRITALLGIKYPIIQAGMIWCSNWELAAGVSKAGGLGLIGSGSMDPDTLRAHIRKCKAATERPFGVNVPLLFPSAEEFMTIIVEEEVPVVFTSAGSPSRWTGFLKDHGIKVVHVVANTKFARKSEDAGVDAIVAEGFEAGGHNGSEETTTLTLIPMVKQVVNIPVIAAGGIATGSGMLAAMALGAEGVQIGSRFVASNESSAHPSFKQKVVEAGDGDTMLVMKKLVAVRLLRNHFMDQVIDAERGCASKEELSELLGRGRARLGMFEGDVENGELEIGQIAGLIKEIKPAAEIVSDIINEYNETLKSLKNPG